MINTVKLSNALSSFTYRLAGVHPVIRLRETPYKLKKLQVLAVLLPAHHRLRTYCKSQMTL